jgi:hypothetical protein
MNIYLYFPYFLIDLGEIRCRISPHNTIKLCEFYENRLSESHTVHSDVNEFLPLLSTFIVHFWVKFSVSNLHIVLLRIYDLYENLHREGHTLYGHKLNHSFACTVKLNDILKDQGTSLNLDFRLPPRC